MQHCSGLESLNHRSGRVTVQGKRWGVAINGNGDDDSSYHYYDEDDFHDDGGIDNNDYNDDDKSDDNKQRTGVLTLTRF